MPEPMPPQHVQAYKDATDNIIFLKKMQWQVTNYTVVVLAALYILVSTNRSAWKELFEILVWLAAGASIGEIWIMHSSMQIFRDRICKLTLPPYFDKGDQKNLHLWESHDHFWQGNMMSLILSTVCFAAALVTTYVIAMQPRN